MQLVLSFDNHIVRFVANCDMILNALTFDRWSMDNCRALIRTNSQPHNYQQLIAVCRHLWLIHSVIMSTKYAMSEFQLNFFGIFIRTSFSRLGQPVARWANVKSVIWLHSSKSIRSKYLQFYMKCERKAVVVHRKKNWKIFTFPSAWKPKSVNWWQPATSNVFKYRLCWANDISVWSVSSAHFDTHNFCKFKQVSAIFWIATSVTLYSTRKNKIFVLSREHN